PPQVPPPAPPRPGVAATALRGRRRVCPAVRLPPGSTQSAAAPRSGGRPWRPARTAAGVARHGRRRRARDARVDAAWSGGAVKGTPGKRDDGRELLAIYRRHPAALDRCAHTPGHCRSGGLATQVVGAAGRTPADSIV